MTAMYVPTRTATLWEDEQPIAMITLTDEGKLLVTARDAQRQDELARFIAIEYRQQRRAALVDRRTFDASLFLFDLPQLLGMSSLHATRSSFLDTFTPPAPFRLPPLDPQTFRPRQKRQNPKAS